MGSKEDLRRIGREGFALVDKYFDKKGRPASVKLDQRSALKRCEYQPQKNPLLQIKPIPAEYHEVVQFDDTSKDYHNWCQFHPQQNPLHQVKPVPTECYVVVHFSEATSTKDDLKWAFTTKPY